MVKVINITASNIVAGVLKAKDGKTYFDLDNSELCAESEITPSKMKIRNAVLSLLSGDGLERILLGELEYGDALMFADHEGSPLGGLISRGGVLYGSFPPEGNTIPEDRKPVWKTITYTDGTGAAQTATVLAGIKL